MKSIIVSGNFGETPKPSSVATKLHQNLGGEIINGGTTLDIDLHGYDLIIWIPNIDNEIEKTYPKKDIGSVLICSKVLRENRNIGDAVSRVFKMNANAVIAINNTTKPFSFQFVDALGNQWCKTTDLKELSDSILKLYNWSKQSIRVKSEKNTQLKIDYPLQEFCDIIKIVADKVENERGGRYFGNASTRCSKMFPSARTDYSILVSARNIAKDRITPEDFVTSSLYRLPILKINAAPTLNADIYYNSNNPSAKPSVDTPVQLQLYNNFNINYIIHGHAYIESAPFTNHYYPCGDLREVQEIKEQFHQGNFAINLKNHGFIIATKNLQEMMKIVNNSKFIYRNIGEEIL